MWVSWVCVCILCVCVCVCIYTCACEQTYICINIYTYIYIYIHIYIQTVWEGFNMGNNAFDPLHRRVFWRVDVCKCLCVRVYKYLRACVRLCVHVCTFIQFGWFNVSLNLSMNFFFYLDNEQSLVWYVVIILKSLLLHW